MIKTRLAATVLGLAQSVGGLLGVPVILPEGNQDPTDAPADVALDLTRACTEFAKRDFVSLEEGLARTVAWQRELYRQA